DVYKKAAKQAKQPVKVAVGAGPANLARHVYFHGPYKNAEALSRALAPIFNAEMKELVAAGAKYLQFEDLGACMPLFSNDKNDYKWIREVVEQCCDGVNAKIGWHFCFGNAWGNDILSANFPQGYQTVLPYFFGTAGINEFVLDYANRAMAGVDFLKNLPKDTGIQVGVLDIRTNAIEKPEQIAGRIREVLKYVPAEKVTLSSDCGMKPLARMVAKMKLRALTEGAGDQGLMFGYACNETPELMPLPIMLAHKLARGLSERRRDGSLGYLRPDGKSQVTIEYEGTRPVRVDAVVVSSQHSPDVSQ